MGHDMPIDSSRSQQRDLKRCFDFNEFRSLSDPIIFGLPSIDQNGGLEMNKQELWFAGLARAPGAGNQTNWPKKV